MPADLEGDRRALDLAAIQTGLRASRYGCKLRILDRVTSTNDEARRMAAEAPAGSVILADEQTAGRGQHGRAWSSPAGTSLYLSILDRPNLDGRSLPMLTLAVGLAVSDVADEVLSRSGVTARSRIKWPNDVRVAGRKIAGILVESTSEGGRVGPVVIGIGLNVKERPWPEELIDKAASLEDFTVRPLERMAVLAQLLDAVETRVDRLAAGAHAELIADLEERLEWRQQRVRCGEIEGVLIGLAPSGALRIATTDGERQVISGSPEPLD